MNTENTLLIDLVFLMMVPIVAIPDNKKPDNKKPASKNHIFDVQCQIGTQIKNHQVKKYALKKVLLILR